VLTTFTFSADVPTAVRERVQTVEDLVAYVVNHVDPRTGVRVSWDAPPESRSWQQQNDDRRAEDARWASLPGMY
jgi:hypothetical protein